MSLYNLLVKFKRDGKTDANKDGTVNVGKNENGGLHLWL